MRSVCNVTDIGTVSTPGEPNSKLGPAFFVYYSTVILEKSTVSSLLPTEVKYHILDYLGSRGYQTRRENILNSAPG